MTRTRKHLLFTIPVACIVFLISLAFLPGAYGSGSPAPVFPGGSPWCSQRDVSAMVVYQSDLYVGTTEWTTGCELWRYGGGSWARVGSRGLDDPDNDGIVSLASYESNLYVGTLNWVDGCGLWRYDGDSWEPVRSGGFGDVHNQAVSSIITFNGKLYAGMENHNTGCEVWASSDGTTWNKVNPDGFGDVDNGGAPSMAVFDSKIFVGTNNRRSGCEVWSSADGMTWNQVNTDGFGDFHNYGISSMSALGTGLYAGTWNNETGCEVWATTDGNTWNQVNVDGFGNAHNVDVSALTVFKSRIFAGTYNQDTGCEVWASSDGTTWETAGTGGFGDKRNVDAGALAVFESHLFAGTNGWDTGCLVYRTSGTGTLPYTDWTRVSVNGFDGATWYMAEGSTYDGFETWVLIQNPGDTPAQAGVTYQTDWGEVPAPGVALAPMSRQSFNVSDTVETFSVSTEVNSDRQLVGERAVYYNDRQCATGSIGATSANTEWHFAEGSTYGGFETWILVENPMHYAAKVNLTYYTESGPVFGPELEVAPMSRQTVNVAQTVQSVGVATEVTSDTPIVAERALYYNDRQCATGSIGACGPETEWYLAEGSTFGGFETWILLVNPGEETANVDVSFLTDSGEVPGPTVTIEPGSRQNVEVSEFVETFDVSTVLTSDEPVVAERAVYYDNRGCATGSVGSTREARTWLVAEGSTFGGFETWVLILNPGDDTAGVDLTFMTEVGPVQGPSLEIAPRSRESVNVSETVEAFSVSTKIASDAPLVVERAVYFNDRNCATGSIGFPVD